jgi:hypothetical protein
VDPSPDSIAATMVEIFLDGVSNGHRPQRTSHDRAGRAPRTLVGSKAHARM